MKGYIFLSAINCFRWIWEKNVLPVVHNLETLITFVIIRLINTAFELTGKLVGSPNLFNKEV